MDLTGRPAIITGAGSGLGAVIARRLADEGAHVVIGDRDLAAARCAAQRLVSTGSQATALEVDLSDSTEVRDFVTRALEHGAPAVLVNNAGGWGPGDQYPAADEATWRRAMELNLLGPMLATQLVLDPMRSAGGGAVVNVASVAGTESGAYGSPTYAAAKAGLVRFTTALTGLEKTHHVRVGCIVPGWIGLPRAIAERASMTTEERAAAGPLVPPGLVAGAALDLVHQRSPGQVVELIGDQTRVLH